MPPCRRRQALPAPGFGGAARPARQRAVLVVHLREQQAADLLDVVAVADALVAQHVGVSPDLADEGAVVGASWGVQGPEGPRRSQRRSQVVVLIEFLREDRFVFHSSRKQAATAMGCCEAGRRSPCSGV